VSRVGERSLGYEQPASEQPVFDPFSGTTTVAAKEFGRFFLGAEVDEGFAGLAAWRVAAAERGALPQEFSERFWNEA
jgi:hypothetical protein